MRRKLMIVLSVLLVVTMVIVLVACTKGKGNDKPTEYTITYVLAGGSATNPTTFTDQTETFTLNNPTKEGYDFVGWTWEGQTTPQKTVNVEKGSTGNKRFIATYSIHHYTITYVLNGGTNPEHNPSTFTFEDDKIKILKAVKEGYEFLGWTRAGETVPTSDMFIESGTKKDITLTAHFGEWSEFTNVPGKDYENGFTKSGLFNATKVNIISFDYKLVTPAENPEDSTFVFMVFNEALDFEWNKYFGYVSFNPYTNESNKDCLTITEKGDGWYTVKYNLWTSPVSTPISRDYVVTDFYMRGEHTNCVVTLDNFTVETQDIIELPEGFDDDNFAANGSWTAFLFDDFTVAKRDDLKFDVFVSKAGTAEVRLFRDDEDGNWCESTAALRFNVDDSEQNSEGVTVELKEGNVYTVTIDIEQANLIDGATAKTEFTILRFTDGSQADVYVANFQKVEGDPLPGEDVVVPDNFVKKGDWSDISLPGFTISSVDKVTFDIYCATSGDVYVRFWIGWGKSTVDGGFRFDLEDPTNNHACVSYVEKAEGSNIYTVTVDLSKMTSGEFADGADEYTQFNVMRFVPGTTADIYIDVDSLAKIAGTPLPTRYSIAYDLNGGDVATGNPTEYTEQTDDFTLNNPTKANYNFIGWTWEGQETPEMSVTIEKGTTGNKAFKANYTAQSYSIEYNLNGGVAENPANYTIESDDITLVAPSKADYDFVGWTYEGQETPQLSVTIEKGTTGNKAFTANYTAQSYSIEYNLNGGSAENPATYTIESADITLVAPVKDAYDFIGWTWDGQETPQLSVTIENGTTGNKAFTANYEPLVYSISYELDEDATNAASNPTSYTIESEDITLAAPSKEDHAFLGWTYEGQETPTVVVIRQGSKGNKVFTAVFTALDPNTFIIQYNLDGGSATNPATYTDQTLTFTLNNPTKDGYDFIGWTYEGQETPQLSVTIEKGTTGDKAYTANYTVHSYSIEYTLNGGAAENPANYTIESADITLVAPVKNGYDFIGWTWEGQETPEMSVTIENGTIGDKAFTANYTLNDYTIEYTLNGGEVASANPTSYTFETETFTLNNPSKADYDFAGWTWDGQETPQTIVTIEQGSVGNRSYVANWTDKVYVLEGGETLSDVFSVGHHQYLSFEIKAEEPGKSLRLKFSDNGTNIWSDNTATRHLVVTINEGSATVDQSWAGVEELGDGWYRVWVNFSTVTYYNEGAATPGDFAIAFIEENTNGTFYTKKWKANDEDFAHAIIYNIDSSTDYKYFNVEADKVMSFDVKVKTNGGEKTSMTMKFADKDNIWVDERCSAYVEVVFGENCSVDQHWAAIEKLDGDWYRVWIDFRNVSYKDKDGVSVLGPTGNYEVVYVWKIDGTFATSNWAQHDERAPHLNTITVTSASTHENKFNVAKDEVLSFDIKVVTPATSGETKLRGYFSNNAGIWTNSKSSDFLTITFADGNVSVNKTWACAQALQDGWYRVWVDFEQAPTKTLGEGDPMVGNYTSLRIEEVGTGCVFEIADMIKSDSKPLHQSLTLIDDSTEYKDLFLARDDQWLSFDLRVNTPAETDETYLQLKFSDKAGIWNNATSTDYVVITFGDTVTDDRSWVYVEELEDGWVRIWVDFANVTYDHASPTGPASEKFNDVYVWHFAGTFDSSEWAVHNSGPVID